MENQEQNNNIEPTPSNFNITISVLNSTENWLELPDFDMSVTEALNFMLEKLNIPKQTDEKTKLKYFLLRRSETAPDGFEIMAETDKYGEPVTLSEYGITNGNKLDIGAIVLPEGKTDIKLKGTEKITFFNDDDIIYEL